jgi:tetratricopeptide (TPR) repeat protein
LGIDIQSFGTPESQRESQRLCRKALELDPNYAMAWVMLGWGYHNEFDVGVGYGSEEGRAAALGSASDCANKAFELDPSCADAYAISAMCHLSKGEYDQAIAASEKAVMLSPNHAENLAVSAVIQIKSGRPDRALELIRKAMRLCPICPNWYLWVLGTAYRLTGRPDSAVIAFESAIKRDADSLAVHAGLASTLGELGRQADAKKSVSQILRIAPDFSIKRYMDGLSYKDLSESARFENGLRKAGLPE